MFFDVPVPEEAAHREFGREVRKRLVDWWDWSWRLARVTNCYLFPSRSRGSHAFIFRSPIINSSRRLSWLIVWS